MMQLSKILIAMTMLMGYANAAVYNVALSYKLKNKNAICADLDEDLLEAITKEALHLAGLDLAGKSNNWMIFPEKVSNDKKVGMGNPDDGGRFLQGCNSFCEFMCNSGSLYWCTCCSCCGSGRRLKVDDAVPLPDIEAAVTANALDLLEASEPIPCLHPKFDVISQVELHQNV